MSAYRFEWNYDDIKDKESFKKFVEDMKTATEPCCNYEQAARLFFDNGKRRFVMIELQVPTSAMNDDGENHQPWLDAYEVSSMDDYDTSREIDSMRYEGKIKFENAEYMMIKFATEVCKSME